MSYADVKCDNIADRRRYRYFGSIFEAWDAVSSRPDMQSVIVVKMILAIECELNDDAFVVIENWASEIAIRKNGFAGILMPTASIVEMSITMKQKLRRRSIKETTDRV
jgi:hypothetical protein